MNTASAIDEGYERRRREELEISNVEITSLDSNALVHELMVLDRRLNHFPAGLSALPHAERVGWLNRLSARRADLLIEAMARMDRKK